MRYLTRASELVHQRLQTSRPSLEAQNAKNALASPKVLIVTSVTCSLGRRQHRS